MNPHCARIGPVDAAFVRPVWSVMIPTYHCARYLGETLRSVLAQDPGPDAMQIEVVDDHSTQDDPERVVREVGPTVAIREIQNRRLKSATWWPSCPEGPASRGARGASLP